jgi:methionyl-tRNA synthetase
MTKSFYVTTPIYYVNGAPHIGHAYTSIAADVLARWKRLDGYDVFFLTGTDEHGQKVEKAALDAGVDPQSFTDRVAEEFKSLAVTLGLSNDDFIRTTEERHKRACTALWTKLLDAGDIYLDHYEGWYAVRDEAFYGEDELTTNVHGIRVAPSGAPVEWVREPSYFFRLSAWQDKLLAHYDANPDFIGPNARRNEVLSFVRGGLIDLSVSRTSFTWGVPVPNDPAHVMYVWLDALTNYLTATGYPDADAPRAHFWPADVHMVGKDIIRFHAVYWPALISRLNVELANDLGNLCQRSLSMIAKNCEGRLPPLPAPLTEADTALLSQAQALPALLGAAIEAQAYHVALEEAWKVIRAGNAYIDHQAPWALKKTDIVRMGSVLRVLADVIRHVATVLQPFMPDSMERMLDQLVVPAEARTLAGLSTPLVDGATLPAPQGIFPRFVEEVA